MAGTFTVVSSDAEDGAIVSTDYNGVNYQATVTSNVAVIEIPTADLVTTTSSSSTVLLTAAGGTDTETTGLYSYQIPVSSDWISTTFGTNTSSLIDATTSYTVQRDHRYRYRENGTTTDLYTVEDTSTNFATHSLDVSGLSPDTTYQIWPQSRDDASSPWVDMAGPFTQSTSAAPAVTSWTLINDSDWTTTGVNNSSISSDWTGSNGFVSDAGSTDGHRVRISQGDNYGVSKYFEGLPANSQDVEFRYRVFIPADYRSYWQTTDAHIKQSGICGKVSAENGGFGGSANTHLLPIYRAWSARGLLDRFFLRHGGEQYWQGSTNGPNGTNANGQDLYNGDAWWDSSNGTYSGGAEELIAGQWNEVHQRIVMNTPNNADGAMYNYVNGNDGYIETGIEWVKPYPNWAADQSAGLISGWTSENEMLQIFRLWFDVYHGGSAKASAGDLYMFYRQFEYKVNA